MGSPTTPPRTSIFASLLRGTALYTITLFAQRMPGVILLPVNTRYLTPTDFGVLDLLEKFGTVVAVLLGMHISASMGYFYFQTDSQDHRREVVSSTLIGVTLVGLLATCLCLPFLNPLLRLVFHNPDIRPCLILVFASFPISFLGEALFGWLRVADRPVVFSLASLARIGVAIVSTLLLVAVLRLRTIGVLASNIGAALVVTVVLAVYCLREVQLRFSPSLFFRMARFSLPLGFGALAMFVIHFGDSFILPQYRSFSELGIYSLAYKIGMLIALLQAAFATYWSAQVYDIVRRDNAHDIISRLFTWLAVVTCFCAVALVVFCRPLLRLMVAPAFLPAAGLVPLIVLAYVIRTFADFFQRFFVAAGRPGYDAITNWVGAAVCLSGYFTLIPRFGMWGAATATILAFLTVGLIATIWTYRLRPYRIDPPRLIKIGVVSAAVIALYYAVPVHGQVLEWVWSVFLAALFPGLLWIWRFPQADEIARLNQLLREGVRRGRAFVSATP